MQSVLQDHLIKIDHGNSNSFIRNIDFIYLINLDQRPEKWKNCQDQLREYDIFPFRVPAIYGWELSSSVLGDLGVLFLPGMQFSPSNESCGIAFLKSQQYKMKLDQSCYNMRFISQWMSLGAIGCMLSHLSVLQDAYDSGYQTILVMEDDIYVKENPHLLSDYIDKLDGVVGSDGWDVLYTDIGGFSGNGDERDCNLPFYYPWFWRPNAKIKDYSFIVAQHEVGNDFIEHGTRSRTHSMIIRRSGMKKILDYEKNEGLFLPIDIDISFIPGIKLFSLKSNIITYTDRTSDTHNRNF